MFTIFGPIIVVAILLAVPLWIFFVPLLILALVCLRFWRQTRIRKTCGIMGVLIALISISFVAVQASFRMEADKRLEWQFGVTVKPTQVARYRFVPAGIGDTCEYWKIRNADPNNYTRTIRELNLTRIDSDRLFPPGSMNGSPRWWPKSTKGYLVFEGEDSLGGSKEVWIPEKGSNVYLHCFLE